MIPWRYHLVSIMAIFLALGLGVLVGTTVINPGLVKNLSSQTERADAACTRISSRTSRTCSRS